MSDTSLGQSDEDFMKQDHTEFLNDEPGDAAQVETEIESSGIPDEEVTSEVIAEEDSQAQEQPAANEDEDVLGQPDEDTQTELEASTDDEATVSLDTSKDDSQDTDGDTQETKEFDYESAFKEVTKPFKANGTEMSVKDPQDIVSLMQMGANYQKKMAQMKPNLKMIKMLENNDLLSEEKLNNLIAISKKDPTAIAKLIQESGIDPRDIDADVPVDYSPTDYSISEKEHNLDQVLESIKDSDTFSQTINVLTKEWDTASKTTVSDNPNIIKVIDTHMGNGVYEKVNTILQQEKTLGRLDGVSDLEAYQSIAEYLRKEGVLEADKAGVTTSKVSKETEDKSQANAERNDKRNAVAPVKQTAAKVANAAKDILNLSDEEFMKLG